MAKKEATNGKMTASPRLDKLIGYFVETRDQSNEMKKRHKEEHAKYDNALEVLSAEIIKELDANGIQAARTAAGTASLSSHDTASASNPDLLVDYVRENNAFELLDRKPNVTACKEFLKEHGKLPPGVKLNMKRTVRVNSPREEIAE